MTYEEPNLTITLYGSNDVIPSSSQEESKGGKISGEDDPI